MSKRTVVRNGVVYSPTGPREVDVAIVDGFIDEVGTVTGPIGETIDAAGKFVFPGAFDTHVHMRDPGASHKEDFGSGTKAAVAGGVTTVFDMPNTTPMTITVEALQEKRKILATKAYANFGLYFGATPTNLDEALRVENVPALKIFMAQSTGDLLVYKPEELELFFKSFWGKIAVHAEDELRLRERIEEHKDNTDVRVHSIARDPIAAAMGVETACEFATQYDRPLHILHMSTKAELDMLERYRGKSQNQITCEVCPHHMFADVTDYDRLDTYIQMNPPIRDPSDRTFIVEALKAGRVDMVATDHAPHLPEEKDQGYPNTPSGVPGVEWMLPLLLDGAHRGEWSYEDVVRWTAHRPSEIYNVENRGRLKVGFHADVTIVDPALTREVLNADTVSRCGWGPWHGKTLTGWPVITIVNGEVAYVRATNTFGPISGKEVRFRR